MKKTLLLSLSMVSLSCYSFADEASDLKAKELMSTMEITKNVEKSFAQISKLTDGMIDAQNLTGEEKEKAKKLSRSSSKVTFDEMLKMDWEGMFSEIYSEVFTAEELQGLIDFYKTPVGQKFLSKQPELQQATMIRMQAEMAKVMPKIQEAIQKSIAASKE